MIDVRQPSLVKLELNVVNALHAANDCLIAKTRQWLEDKSVSPEASLRWEWAQVIVQRCDKELTASVAEVPARDTGLLAFQF